jgi:hypothetical protein
MEHTVTDDLTDLIARAAPRATIPQDVAVLAVDLLPPQRRRWPLSVAIIAPALLLLGAGTATAMTTWNEWAWWADTAIEQTFEHETCRFWFQVEPIGVPIDDPAVVEAASILNALDLDALATSDEYLEMLHEIESDPERQEAVDKGLVPTWAPQANAMFAVVNRIVRSELADAGFDPDSVGVKSSLLECEPR